MELLYANANACWYYINMKFPWQKKDETSLQQSHEEMTAADYERIGRVVEQVFVSGYATKKRLFLMSLYKGVGYGLGIFIGGTIIVALLAYAISQFETVPLLNEIIEPIRNTIQEVNGGPLYPSQQ